MFLLLLIFLLMQFGCVEYIKEPDFLNEKFQTKQGISQYDKQESNALAAE